MKYKINLKCYHILEEVYSIVDFEYESDARITDENIGKLTLVKLCENGR